jgi:hypothetical protein
MFTTLIKLELAFLDKLNREELIAKLMESQEGVALDFARDWLDAQSTDRLRLYVLAARLFRILRQRVDPKPIVPIRRPGDRRQ